jgi:hypothetical protein
LLGTRKKIVLLVVNRQLSTTHRACLSVKQISKGEAQNERFGSSARAMAEISSERCLVGIVLHIFCRCSASWF